MRFACCASRGAVKRSSANGAADRSSTSDAAIAQRVIYAEAAARGLTVIEAAPAGEAAAEVMRLAKELIADERRLAA